MPEKFDATKLANDVLGLLAEQGLSPDTLGIVLTMPRPDFENIAKDHPGHLPELILLRGGEQVQWFVQIALMRMPEDFPTGAILYPTPDE